MPSSSSGFPTNYGAVRDVLYLNQGVGTGGRATFREVGRAAGIEGQRVAHGLGAAMFDYDLDGRLDLYVANDADPNQLYRNVPRSGGLGFRLVEVAKAEAVDDPNAGMGIAAADFSLDGRTDLFVTNSREQLHAAYRSRPHGAVRPSFADARPELAAVLGTRSTGWGDVVGRPRPRRRPGPRPRERRDSGRRSCDGRTARSGAREPAEMTGAVHRGSPRPSDCSGRPA